jgi:hypothetical protein
MVRAADDFPAIRARLDELKRQREAAAASDHQATLGPRPYAVSLKLARPGLRVPQPGRRWPSLTA